MALRPRPHPPVPTLSLSGEAMLRWMICLVLALGVATSFGAGAGRQGAVLTIVEENDLVVDTDRHYTQGIKISYLHTDDYLPMGSDRLHDLLPQIGFRSEAGKFGYAIGQNIYTPADLGSVALLPNDRPYAGWLYGGVILQRRGTSLRNRPAQEEFEFEYGFVGPSSLARESQTWVHQVRGFDVPQGWHNQLRNEPALRLKYWRGIRLLDWSCGPLGIDFSPHTGLSLGNVDTSARLGARLRVGINLPDDFGFQPIDSLATTAGGAAVGERTRRGAYLFAGTEGRAVLHNVFLDGNLFERSHRVDKEPLVGDITVGFVLALKRFEVGYAHFFRTREFDRQTEEDSYGALFAKFKF